MSNETTKRVPMLSDEDIRRYGFDEMDVREEYESLITEGKLRVVEEVDSCDDTGCSKCGHYTEDQYGQYLFCPGCGNKIKR